MASLRRKVVPLARSLQHVCPAGRNPQLQRSIHCRIARIPMGSSLLSARVHGGTRQTKPHSTIRTFSSSPCQHFNTSSTYLADSSEGPPAKAAPEAPRNSLSSLSRALGLGDTGRGRAPDSLVEYSSGYQPPGEHHLYIYAHKHNCHVTLSAPQYLDPQTQKMRQKVLMTLSTGNIGYKKSQRGTYEAAFQLGGYVFNRIHLDGLMPKIQRLEVVLRGFGPGREALIKLLLGQEGAGLRDRVVRVTDASRVKMGGQRARKPRRLG